MMPYENEHKFIHRVDSTENRQKYFVWRIKFFLLYFYCIFT